MPTVRCRSEYWSRHLRQPVRFAAALERLVTDAPSRVLLEVGPRTTLSQLARQHPAAQKAQMPAVPSLGDSAEVEAASLRWAAGQLWCRGAAIDVAQFDRRHRRRRLRLPTYPFERQRCWVEAATSDAVSLPATNKVAARAVDDTPTASVDVPVASGGDRRSRLLAQLRELFGDSTGFDMADVDESANFIELGLDSLMLTQVALRLQKTFTVPVTFRQLMTDCTSLERLSCMLDERLAEQAVGPPRELVPEPSAMTAAVPSPTLERDDGGRCRCRRDCPLS